MDLHDVAMLGVTRKVTYTIDPPPATDRGRPLMFVKDDEGRRIRVAQLRFTLGELRYEVWGWLQTKKDQDAARLGTYLISGELPVEVIAAIGWFNLVDRDPQEESTS